MNNTNNNQSTSSWAATFNSGPADPSLTASSTISTLANTVYVANPNPNISYISSYETTYETTLRDILDYFTVDEVEKLIDNMIVRMSENDFQLFLETVLKSRHFSEEFIMKYIHLIPEFRIRNTLLNKHRAEILSGEYANVKLFLDLKK